MATFPFTLRDQEGTVQSSFNRTPTPNVGATEYSTFPGRRASPMDCQSSERVSRRRSKAMRR